MSRTPDNTIEIRIDPLPGCRIAYTLNNAQPVRCTMIGDQPLFYMDYEGVEAEDDLMLFGDELLESAPQTAPDAIIDLFAQSSREIIGQEFEVQELGQVLSILERSRFGDALLKEAQERGICILQNSYVDGAQYDARAKAIFLHPLLSLEDQVLLLVRELRRAWQGARGALIHPLTFHPDQAIFVNRAQQADLAVSMVRVGWELALAGNTEYRRRLETSQSADLARAFSREAGLDFRALSDGRAMAAAFESWFLSARCQKLDRVLVQGMLSDYHGYVFDLSAATSRTVTAEFLSTLGSVPFGKNYLTMIGQGMLSDPLFTEVRDRSSANFLWFIKFERSFRQAEHDLQLRGDTSSGSASDGSPSPSVTELPDDSASASASRLYHLPVRGTEGAEPARRATQGGRGSGEVVDIGAWRRDS